MLRSAFNSIEASRFRQKSLSDFPHESIRDVGHASPSPTSRLAPHQTRTGDAPSTIRAAIRSSKSALRRTTAPNYSRVDSPVASPPSQGGWVQLLWATGMSQYWDCSYCSDQPRRIRVAARSNSFTTSVSEVSNACKRRPS
jgi:hypothetical protein